MNITEIQKRLMNLIDKHHDTYNRTYSLALYNGANPEEVADSYHLALWLEGAEAGVKNQFLSIFDSSYCDVGLRVCGACGKFMTEGYILRGMDWYACSDSCAVALYMNDYRKRIGMNQVPAEAKRDLDYDLEHYPDDNFWTEWYQEL